MEFIIRDYCKETDLEEFYQAYYDLSWKTTAHLVSGVSPTAYLGEFERGLLEDQFNHLRFPYIVADRETNKPIGVTKVGRYNRQTRHRDVWVYLWERADELTQAVLQKTIDTIFSRGDSMAVVKVAGYERSLLISCRNLNMIQVGCIPDYVCYGEHKAELYPEYTFIIKRDDWEKIN